MKPNEKEAAAPASATASNTCPVPSMPHSKRKNKTSINVNQRVRQIALKFYDEQIPDREGFIGAIESLEKLKYQCIAICHDRDILTDGIWEAATEKRHYHVIFRLIDKNARMTIKRICDLLGIVFRPGLDDSLIAGHGIETVGNFAAYATYLTHETDAAVKAGKELYSLTELISNLSVEEIKQIREGYVQVAEKRKYTEEEMAALDKEAYQLGYDLKDFEDWIQTLPFNVRRKSDTKVIRQSYEYGIKKRLEESNEVIRCCIFIEGAPNTGKTYTSRKALEACGIPFSRVLVPSDGSGKFDKLKATHKAIVIDDMPCPNMLNMSDNRFCMPYRRNSGNPVWTGLYLIITSNRTFDDYIDDNHITDQKHIEALHSRFFECKLYADSRGHNMLEMLTPSTRGTKTEQLQRYKMFDMFRENFNDLIYDYAPTAECVDYEGLEYDAILKRSMKRKEREERKNNDGREQTGSTEKDV